MPLDTTRDHARAALLGKPAPFKSKSIAIPDGDGYLVLTVREPTHGERVAIQGAAVKTNGAGKAPDINIGRLSFLALVHLVRLPDGGALFEVADEAAVSALPASHPVIAVVMPAALAMLNGGDEGGNSQPTSASSAA